MKSKVVFCPLFDSFPPVRGLRAFNRNNPIGRAARQMFNFNYDTAAADHVIIANISISAEIFFWICVFVFLYLLGGNFDAMKLVWFVFIELYLCVRNCRFVLVYLCLYVCFFCVCIFSCICVFVRGQMFDLNYDTCHDVIIANKRRNATFQINDQTSTHLDVVVCFPYFFFFQYLFWKSL